MPKEGIDREAKLLFYQTVAKISSKEEIEEFFKDLLSSAEIKDLSRRLLAAKLLKSGSTYEDVNSQMGIPTCPN